MQNLKLRPVEELRLQFEAILKGRKQDIALGTALDERQVKVGPKWKSLRVELSAAADKYLAGLGIEIERFEI